MNILDSSKRATILSALIEGASVRSTSRLVGCSKTTVLRLLADAGSYCSDYHDLVVRNVAAKRVQADEVWAFIGGKNRAKNEGAKVHGDSSQHRPEAEAP